VSSIAEPTYHCGELIEEVLPDLMQASRNPWHPDTGALIERVRSVIENSLPIEDDFDEKQRFATQCMWQIEFDTLYAVAEHLVCQEMAS
jgi:hypothetical protein